MDIIQAIKERHSVRRYQDRAIEQAVIEEMKAEVAKINQMSGLNIQMFINEPKAFNSLLAHYGKFRNAKNYLAIVGEKGEDLDERCGYYGEKLVLKLQMLGLNSCWVALTFAKGKIPLQIADGEKLVCVIAFGYGETKGVAHKNKPIEKLYKASEPIPQWFRNGMEMALLAPTAVNQQKFFFTLLAERDVRAEVTGGFYSQIDLGIVKLHFEIGAGKENFEWVN